MGMFLFVSGIFIVGIVACFMINVWLGVIALCGLVLFIIHALNS